jgi:hypothetical protein
MKYIFRGNDILEINVEELLKKINSKNTEVNALDILNERYVKIKIEHDEKGFYFVYKNQIKRLTDFIFKPLDMIINKIENLSIETFIELLIKEKNNLLIEERVPINKKNKTNPPEMKTELCEIKSGVLENDKIITKVLDKDEEYSYNISDLYGLIKYKYFKLINKNEYLSKISAKNLRKIIK